MDIHKPKPWHGAREFLKEYLIIVLGVLTALGAEAIVTRVNDARLSREAREAVRDELSLDVTNVSRRLPLESCVRGRLQELSALLDTAERGTEIRPIDAPGLPPVFTVYTQRWLAATAGGRASLLSSDEQRSLVRLYDPLEKIAEEERIERAAWVELQGLGGLRHLSPSMLDHQRLAIAQARAADQFMLNLTTVARYHAATLGIRTDAKLDIAPGAAPMAGPYPVCEPLTFEGKVTDAAASR